MLTGIFCSGGRVIDRSLNIDHVCDVIIVGDVIEALVDCGGQYDANDDVRDVSGRSVSYLSRSARPLQEK